MKECDSVEQIRLEKCPAPFWAFYLPCFVWPIFSIAYASEYRCVSNISKDTFGKHYLGEIIKWPSC